MLGFRQTRSRGIKTKKNHIILFANVEGPKAGRAIEKAIKKAAREIRKTTGSGVSFEMYIYNTKRGNDGRKRKEQAAGGGIRAAGR